MSIFSAITKVVIDITTLPIAMAKDVITMGGFLTNQDETYTKQKLDEIKKDSEGLRSRL